MTPVFLSTLSSSLHLISVGAWVGLMLFFLFVFGPAVRQLSPGAGIAALNRGREYFQCISSILIVAVLLTGLISFGTRTVQGPSNDSGFAWILGLKIFLFFAMSVHHVLQAAKYSPKLIELTAQEAPRSQAWAEPLLSLWRRWFLLLKMNAALGTFTLLLGLFLKGR
ncbi:MAG: hypothetical protein ACREQK_15540 [Candidatus Binatia bacterium]